MKDNDDPLNVDSPKEQPTADKQTAQDARSQDVVQFEEELMRNLRESDDAELQQSNRWFWVMVTVFTILLAVILISLLMKRSR